MVIALNLVLALLVVGAIVTLIALAIRFEHRHRRDLNAKRRTKPLSE